jgi:hypothetical protein
MTSGRSTLGLRKTPRERGRLAAFAIAYVPPPATATPDPESCGLRHRLHTRVVLLTLLARRLIAVGDRLPNPPYGHDEQPRRERPYGP